MAILGKREAKMRRGEQFGTVGEVWEGRGSLESWWEEDKGCELGERREGDDRPILPSTPWTISTQISCTYWSTCQHY